MGERKQVSGLHALMDPAMAVECAKGRAESATVLVHDGAAEFIVDGRHSSFPVDADGSYDFDDLLRSWVEVSSK